jgi:hypothetical protein
VGKKAVISPGSSIGGRYRFSAKTAPHDTKMLKMIAVKNVVRSSCQ